MDIYSESYSFTVGWFLDFSTFGDWMWSNWTHNELQKKGLKKHNSFIYGEIYCIKGLPKIYFNNI